MYLDEFYKFADVLIDDIAEFAKQEVPRLLALIEDMRFLNQGAFNDNPKWADNQPGIRKQQYAYFHGKYGGKKRYPFKTVQQDKGFNFPLYDSGNLYRELTNPENWKSSVTTAGNRITISFPDVETFTDTKYDKLDTGTGAQQYVSRRGNYVAVNYIPARPFKKISQADKVWIIKELIKSLKDRYETSGNITLL